ncbi:MAG: MCP four helix bundle domain-containing protein, partial [Mucilaginibacter polytrichastri]|nr:MCP four helix bundle domain-containing protein [Mucilaginibacter polytrichastri]
MTIKNKLRLGFTFLFIIFVILGGIAIWYINQLSKASTDILKDNYETLQYAQVMMQNLGDDDQQMSAKTQEIFEGALKNQEKNVTEVGEGDATKAIRSNFDDIRRNNLKDDLLGESKDLIRQSVFRIIDLNMQAIVRKNDTAARTAHNATIFVALMATFCFLAAFSFIVNFPGYIANPIRELSEGIKEITRKNYSRRIEIHSKDEF